MLQKKTISVSFMPEEFQDDGYYCKKYFFISIFCLVMASSTAVVNLVSLFNFCVFQFN